MRNLTSFGIGLALALSTISSAWADCTFNEAEALNAEVTSRGVTIDRPSDGWTAETDERFEEIKNGSSQESVHVERDWDLKSMRSIRYLEVVKLSTYLRRNSCSLRVWSRQRSSCKGFVW